jgi:hypothetical protein
MPRKVINDSPQINDKNPFEGWSTLSDAARKVGRNPSTVRLWMTRGLIKSYIVGNSVILVNIDEVRAMSEKYPPYKTWGIDKTAKKG